MKNVCRLTVRGYELDSFGHVNNSVYLQYAETAMWDFFSKHGMLDKIQDEGLFPVILESKQRYIHELKLMDKVLIETDMSFSGGVAGGLPRMSLRRLLITTTRQMTQASMAWNARSPMRTRKKAPMAVPAMVGKSSCRKIFLFR